MSSVGQVLHGSTVWGKEAHLQPELEARESTTAL